MSGSSSKYRKLFSAVLDELNEIISSPMSCDCDGYDKKLLKYARGQFGGMSLPMGCREISYKIMVGNKTVILLKGFGNGHNCGCEVSDGINYISVINEIMIHIDDIPINPLYKWTLSKDQNAQMLESYGKLMYILGAIKQTHPEK